jgi:molybdopterin synthase catalytic subunit
VSVTADPTTLVLLVDDPIDLGAVHEAVRARSCGAVCTFVGTSRDVHEGRPVARLEYEAYRPMAEKELRSLADEVRQRFPGAHGVALVHRLGSVPLAEASVAVAVSTAHRDEAFRACRWAIDELKRRVPIWKRESYRDGSAPQWVANAASPHSEGAPGAARSEEVSP